MSCWRLCSFPLFRPSNLGYIGRGLLLNRENHPPSTSLDPAVTSSTARFPTVGARLRGHETYHVADYARSPLFRLSNLGHIGRGILLNRDNHSPFTRLDPALTSSTKKSPTVGARPRAHETYRVGNYARSPSFRNSILEHIGRGILLNRENHPPFTRLDPALTSSTTKSSTVGARPQAHQTYRVGKYARSPIFRTSILRYIGRGVLLNRENHPPFTRLDPPVTSSNPRPPTVGARPPSHETYRVGDYAHSPFFDRQTWDILGEGYC